MLAEKIKNNAKKKLLELQEGGATLASLSREGGQYSRWLYETLNKLSPKSGIDQLEKLAKVLHCKIEDLLK